MSPVISVVMPVWNGEEYLNETLDSIFGQTFEDFELIVVDDGSTDSTSTILRSYDDRRMHVHRLDHAGIVAALNHGLSVARAPWIARHDADDVSMKKRFETQWRALTSEPEATLCFSAIEAIGAVAPDYRPPRLARTRALMALRMCFQCPITHGTVIFKKEAFMKMGGYRMEERHAEDFAAWGRLIEEGPFLGVSEPLVKFRIHEQSVSKRNLETQLALTEKIAVGHCARFMRLTQSEAERAFRALIHCLEPGQKREWSWFMTKAAPRLRWQSAEMWVWLIAQWLKPIAQPQ